MGDRLRAGKPWLPWLRIEAGRHLPTPEEWKAELCVCCVQKRRTLRRTLLQYQRDCQNTDAPMVGGTSNTSTHPAESAKLAVIAQATGDQTRAVSSTAVSGQSQTVAAVSIKAADAKV